jgi:hypothetical protein
MITAKEAAVLTSESEQVKKDFVNYLEKNIKETANQGLKVCEVVIRLISKKMVNSICFDLVNNGFSVNANFEKGGVTFGTVKIRIAW